MSPLRLLEHRVLPHGYALILAVAAIAHVSAIRAIPFREQTDSREIYLPGAEALLDRGLAFFSESASHHTAPLNFVWPALFFAQTDAIVAANVVLSVACLVLVFACARALGGVTAGLAAAILYALSPLIPPLFAHVLSEPLFLFGTTLWLYGTIAAVTGARASSGLWAVVGGIVSVLTRPIWLPFMTLTFAFALIARRLRQPASPVFRRLAAVHAAILAPVALYCIHNLVQFGFFGVSTGGGTALYLGNHPLTLGVEPPLLLLNYDVQAMIAPLNGEYLSVEGDRALREIGWSMIRDRSFGEQIEWLLFKVGALLFFTKNDFDPDLYSIRALRVAEIVLALYALAAVRRRPWRAWIGAALLVQVAQLSLLLYNRRYSVGSIEVPLILLAGCGVARLLEGITAKLTFVRTGVRGSLDFSMTPRALAQRAFVVVIVAAGIGIAHWHRRLTDPIAPDVDRAPTLALLDLREPTMDMSRSVNIAPMPNGAYFVARGEGLFAVHVDMPRGMEPRANYLWALTLIIVPPRDQSCRGGRISFEPDHPSPETRIEAIPISFKGDGKLHRYAISAANPFSPLFATGAGTLRFRAFCPAGTQIGVHKLELLQSIANFHYRSRTRLP